MSLPLISFGDLPADGRQVSGALRTDLFELRAPHDPRFVAPLIYDLNVRVDDGDVIVEGAVQARFELECARCAARLPWAVDLDPYFTCEEKEGETLDLTAQLREDILLALPGYPRCEESNVEPRVCQTEVEFAPDSEFSPLSGAETADPSKPDVWAALDRLPPTGPPSSK